MDYFAHERALIHPEAKIGKGTRCWANTHIQKDAVIGEDCNICDGSFVESGAVVGSRVTIKHNVSIFDGVTIEDDVFIGSNIAFINDKFPRSRAGHWDREKTLVKKGATLGANVTILSDVTVGEYAFVGAGSVVTKDVAPYALVFGNPARFRGYVCRCGKQLDDDCRCSCGKIYTKNKEGLNLNE